jgi:hypothetical protein
MALRRRITAFLLVAAAALGGSQISAADTVLLNGGANNIVIVRTTGQNMVLARASTQISQVAGPTVGSTNIAVASATDCVGCHSTAVAVQTVFVVGSPQFYTPAGQAEVGNLRQQIADTAATVLTNVDDAIALCLRLNDLTSQLKSAIDGELVASGVLATGTPNEHVDVSNGNVDVQSCPGA